jgi:hypothetical protein
MYRQLALGKFLSVIIAAGHLQPVVANGQSSISADDISRRSLHRRALEA